MFVAPDPFWAPIAAGWATFRAFDVLVVFFSLGVFQRLGEKTLTDLSSQPPRLQRHLVTVLLVYVELLFVYATMYLWVGTHQAGAFSSPVACSSQAFAISFMTMTTIGYGNIAPVSGWALGLATAQALTAILGVVVYIASVITLLRGGQPAVPPTNDSTLTAPSTATPPPCKRRAVVVLHYVTPPLVLGLVIIAFWYGSRGTP